MALTLEERFKAFLNQLSITEEMDSSQVAKEFIGEKIPDFLLFERKVILELKTLKTDPSPKVDAQMQMHEEREDYPLFYGEQSIDKVLAHLSDGPSIKATIYRNITRSIEEAVRKADKQIGSARKILNLFDSVGLMVILNQDLGILSPEIIVKRVSELLCFRKNNGKVGYGNIQYVWVISESHHCEIRSGMKAAPSILIEGPAGKMKEWFSYSFRDIEMQWAKYNGMRYYSSNCSKIEGMKFEKAEQSNTRDGQHLTNSDVWRINYNNNPYLRCLSDEQVYEHGKQIMKELTPHFLIGGHKLPEERVKHLTVLWTGFLEEANFRGLDLKIIRFKA